MTPASHAGDTDRSQLELEHLRKQVEKLSLEVDQLRQATFWDRTIGRYLPLMTALLAVAGFWFGVWQYVGQQRAADSQRLEAEKKVADEATAATFRRAEELRRETARPFWEAQLRLYLQAAQAAATVATSRNAADVARAENDFWILYWGPLAAVEDVGLVQKSSAIEAAMVSFGTAVKQHRKDSDSDRSRLERLSLNLAHAIRDAVAPGFDLQAAPSTGERLRKP